jgi:hypothetical protein
VAVAAAATMLFVVTGCEADIRTSLEAGRADATVTVTFTGELADTVRADTDLARSVDDIIADAAGTQPERTDRGDGDLSWTVDVAVADLADTAPLTGISEVTASGDATSTTITTTSPTRLLEAIRSAEQPDGVDAMAEQTRLAIEVHYAGGVTNSTVSGPASAAMLNDVVDGTTAVFATSAADAGDTTLTVTGSPNARPNVMLIVAVLAAGAGAVLLWRSRRRRAEVPSGPPLR